jgi:hypothetical protein
VQLHEQQHAISRNFQRVNGIYPHDGLPSTTSPSSAGYNSSMELLPTYWNFITVLTQADLHFSLVHSYEYNVLCPSQICKNVHTARLKCSSLRMLLMVTAQSVRNLSHSHSQQFDVTFILTSPLSPLNTFNCSQHLQHTRQKNRYPFWTILK